MNVRCANFSQWEGTILFVVYSKKKFLKTDGALNRTKLFPSIFIYEKTTTVIRRITRSRQCLTGWRPVQLWFRSSAAGSGGRRAGIRDAVGLRSRAGGCHSASLRSGACGRGAAGRELRIRALWIRPFPWTVSVRLPSRLSLSPVM